MTVEAKTYAGNIQLARQNSINAMHAGEKGMGYHGGSQSERLVAAGRSGQLNSLAIRQVVAAVEKVEARQTAIERRLDRLDRLG